MPPEIAATVPWHGVLAPEGKWSGDGRRFAENALSTRDLPLPLTWQKASSDGHDGSVVVARIDAVERVDGEMRAIGQFLAVRRSRRGGRDDRRVRHGSGSPSTPTTPSSSSMRRPARSPSPRPGSRPPRSSSIPAFAEAWVSLGTAPPRLHAARRDGL